jgi:hypothetical protein
VLRLLLFLRKVDIRIERITNDLKSEFERLVRRHFFRNPWRYDARTGDSPTIEDIAREFRREGPPNQTLTDAGLVHLPAETMLKLGSEWVWGSEEPSELCKLLEELAAQYLSEKSQEALGSYWEQLEPYVVVAGLFGNPDEIERSGLEQLATISLSDVQKGRSLYQFFVSIADCAARGSEFLPPDVSPALNLALDKIARTLGDSDEWCVAGLAACAIASSRVRSAACSQP